MRAGRASNARIPFRLMMGRGTPAPKRGSTSRIVNAAKTIKEADTT